MSAAIINYATGKNPYDFFRNREVLSQKEELLLKEFGALHIKPLTTFGIHLLGKTGIPFASSIQQQRIQNKEPMTTLQKILQVTPVLSRFIRVTKYGEEESTKRINPHIPKP